MDRKPYRVTDEAGPWVAGRKVKPGAILELTDDQAAYEIARGQIVAHDPLKADEKAEEKPVSEHEGERAIDEAPRNMAIRGAPRKRGE
ncbi:hypothetical protein [Mesorhizobium sp. M2A.F.Ca.ET.039.01.1.1]|uniref:hypothetical protein n=1 Tax=Mesorhizobium sp. M2A.F.Ca.ET.039.01.1.1 TaxID=2496746 RepID=UPI000FCCA2CB|nr:hypothetical protein [Mesorhizobium sp. M2A.F.Ca.ET.039.01.1.1]RWX72590.1 hypothetical protein EOA24_00940 [Mesorhizobium sp. M2A.F.Ca.ET.039.01.1.1]